MENLKALMGSSYHEGVTVEEVNSFLSGKKLVDLKEGKYVDKDKYETLKSEHDALKEKTKDYDEVKANNEKYETEKRDATLNARLENLGFSKNSLKYVKGDIADGTLKLSEDDKAAKEEAKAYLKEHPTFASTPSSGDAKLKGGIIGSTVKTDGDGNNKSVNETINNGILKLAGMSKNPDSGSGN